MVRELIAAPEAPEAARYDGNFYPFSLAELFEQRGTRERRI